MRTLLLARHGETSWNALGKLQGHTDIELHEAGRAQARELAALLTSSGVSGVVTSDLARARETGAIVAAVLGLPPPEIEPALRERAFGVFEGLTRDECAAQHPDAWAAWVAQTGCPPGGEPRQAASARMGATLARVASSRGDGGPLLVVSHGGVMRLWLTSVMVEPVALIGNGHTFLVEHDASGVRARRFTPTAP